MDIMSKYESVSLLAPNMNKGFIIEGLKRLGIDVQAFDYDPKFKRLQYPEFTCADFIFDDVDYSADLVVHFNVEKTAPLEYSGEVILIGDDERHSGDCFPIDDIDQIIDAYNIKELYSHGQMTNKKPKLVTHNYVYGRM